MASKKQASVAGASAPATVPPAPPVPVPSLDAEIADLEGRIAADQARLAALIARRDFKEYPKDVNGRTFGSREEQDAAGPDYAEV